MSSQVDCDVVVVGAGIAGMTGANVLARAGRRVVVVEANHQPGGLMAGIRRKGFYFDVGDQSFESLGIVQPILEDIGFLEEAGLGRVLHRIRGGDRYDIPCESFEQVRAGVLEATEPQHREKTAGFLDEFHQAVKRSEALATWRLNPMLERSPLAAAGAAMRFLAFAVRHGAGVLRDVRTRMDDLAAKWGLPPEIAETLTAGYRRQSMFANAGIWWAWFNDYCYPRGGMERFFGGLQRRAEENGARFLYKRPVSRILVERGRAAGVVTEKGETIRSRAVLYCGDAKRLYGELLAQHPVDSPWRRRVEAAPAGDAILSVYVGLDLPIDDLRRRLNDGTHIFYFPEQAVRRVDDMPDDPDAHSMAWLLVNAPCLHNPEAAPPGKSCMVLQAFTHASWLDRWSLSTRGDRARDPNYKALKRKVQAEIVERALPIVPELRDRIVFQDIGTPQSAVRFTGNTDGSTIGWEFDPRTTPISFPGIRTRTEVPMLFTGGQWFCWPGGVPFAMLSAHQAASQAHRALGRPPKALPAPGARALPAPSPTA